MTRILSKLFEADEQFH